MGTQWGVTRPKQNSKQAGQIPNSFVPHPVCGAHGSLSVPTVVSSSMLCCLQHTVSRLSQLHTAPTAFPGEHYGPDTSNGLGSPWQHRLYLQSITYWPLRRRLQGIQHAILACWSLVQTSVTPLLLIFHVYKSSTVRTVLPSFAADGDVMWRLS